EPGEIDIRLGELCVLRGNRYDARFNVISVGPRPPRPPALGVSVISLPLIFPVYSMSMFPARPCTDRLNEIVSGSTILASVMAAAGWAPCDIVPVSLPASTLSSSVIG